MTWQLWRLTVRRVGLGVLLWRVLLAGSRLRPIRLSNSLGLTMFGRLTSGRMRTWIRTAGSTIVAEFGFLRRSDPVSLLRQARFILQLLGHIRRLQKRKRQAAGGIEVDWTVEKSRVG